MIHVCAEPRAAILLSVDTRSSGKLLSSSNVWERKDRTVATSPVFLIREVPDRSEIRVKSVRLVRSI